MPPAEAFFAGICGNRIRRNRRTPREQHLKPRAMKKGDAPARRARGIARTEGGYF